MDNVPTSFRVWFIIHFIVSLLFGIPCMFAPHWVLGLFDISIISTLAPRLVGAAMFAMGGMSFIAKDSSTDVYRQLLTFKVIWSLAGMIAILLYILEGGKPSAWVIFAFFLIFNCIWTSLRICLNRFSE